MEVGTAIIQDWTLKSLQFSASMRLQTCKKRTTYFLKVGKIFNLVFMASCTLIGFLFIFLGLDNKYYRIHIILPSKCTRKKSCNQDVHIICSEGNSKYYSCLSDIICTVTCLRSIIIIINFPW